MFLIDTPSDKKAKAFIDNVFNTSKTPYDALIKKLEDKIQDWEGDKFMLSLINIFEQTTDETNKYNHLSSLIKYGNHLIWKDSQRRTKLRPFKARSH
jgi:hypothetical protein